MFFLPQMMPINWYPLILIFVTIYTFFIIMIAFNKISFIKSKTQIKLQNKNFYWMW
uniref:ATP synthase F0 subunit 8 n=1 Tax=Acraea poggei TaxID=1337138 RepID=A0A140CV83_9NEOP|nr:ATP synthase F0 subunit 8 [Acraea poggei]AMJ17207.1 ATP synthase F0 subunit 8 [Acraea poggei]